MTEELDNIAERVDKLANNVDTIKRCVIELAHVVRGHVIWNRDPETLGALDAIDRVLRGNNRGMTNG